MWNYIEFGFFFLFQKLSLLPVENISQRDAHSPDNIDKNRHPQIVPCKFLQSNLLLESEMGAFAFLIIRYYSRREKTKIRQFSVPKDIRKIFMECAQTDMHVDGRSEITRNFLKTGLKCAIPSLILFCIGGCYVTVLLH